MEERQTIEEDIHGVSEDIPETEDFVEAKIKEMNEHIAMMSAQEKQAWERAIFLRPSLEHDKSLRLMFLRARRFQSRPAARAMIRQFENRQKLFGDLMIQRLTWDDVRCFVFYSDPFNSLRNLTPTFIHPAINKRARNHSIRDIPINSRPR